VKVFFLGKYRYSYIFIQDGDGTGTASNFRNIEEDVNTLPGTSTFSNIFVTVHIFASIVLKILVDRVKRLLSHTGNFY
jgi:hypothetical protein